MESTMHELSAVTVLSMLLYKRECKRKLFKEKEELYWIRKFGDRDAFSMDGGSCKRKFSQEYPVKVIHNGIDLSKFYPRTRTLFRKKYGLKDETLILGVASEWGERKGFNDFIRLAGELSDNQRLIMVGVNEKQTKELPKSITRSKKQTAWRNLQKFTCG